MNPLDKLEELYINKADCARKLEVTPQRLNGWYAAGFIPYLMGAHIQEKTKGKIKASEIYEWAAKTKRKAVA
jgi:hypothetical protein